ncbi:hypothetical protein LLH06_00230 [Mucilaginibacter daejeonensis]|uniref:hypothetical protein n=1 Tax=Mucilaginibacter daejeonensis TaxID=398049 RepID=UPI001D174D55|nr:hypothetical protein [Mucilaginibacter daejeonensis]UEG53406.1 hypothetical protein LLH06_00230 [Mucilaginibacter daejeonensis]
MKIALPILIAVLFASCSLSTKKDPFEGKPNGKVLKISQYMYEASEKFGETSKGRLINYDVENFDEKGNIQKATYISMFDSTKADTSEVIRKYNRKGEWIALIDLKTGLTEFEHIYDNEGHRIETNQFEGKKLESKTKYLFEGGDLTEGKEYSGDGSLKSTTKYKVDRNGHIVETEELKNDGKPARKDVSSFNDKGFEEKVSAYEGQKLISEYLIKYLKYDKLDNWTVAHHFYKNKPVYIYERKIEYR